MYDNLLSLSPSSAAFLPLSSSSDTIKKIAVIGPNAKAKVISGGGSASLKASYYISPYDGIVKALEGKGIEVGYEQGVQGEYTKFPRPSQI